MGNVERRGGRNGAVLLTPPSQHWACPCGATAVTRLSEPHSQLHPCLLTRGLLTPYVPVPASWQPGDRLSAGIVAVERQDYERHSGVGGPVGESLTRDDRDRPMMGTSVEYDGGAAHALFAPCIEINIGARA